HMQLHSFPTRRSSDLSYRSSMEHQTATTLGGWRVNGDGSGEEVIAHELAHHWFGDWVTCEKWGELWLNEGFASYLPMVFYTGVRSEEHTSELQSRSEL